MIYLDNAATTFPKPACVRNAMAQCMNCYAANPGRGAHPLSMRASEALFDARNTLAGFFGADPVRTIFTANCTHAINYALKGVLQKGDHVIISSLEHNAVFRPLYQMKTNGTITFDVAKVVPNDDEQTLQNFAACMNDRTRLIFCTHVSNIFGTELPIRKLAALAHKNGLLFGLDAAQSAGVFPLQMGTDGIDLLCVPGHKGLFGPMGTGALLFGENIAPVSIMEGGTGSLSMQAEQPNEYPDRLESGTVNLPGIVGLAAGIHFLNRAGGCAAVHEWEAFLTNTLKEDLSVIRGVRQFDLVQNKDASLLSFVIDGVSVEETAELLGTCGFAVRAGFHCAALAHTSMGTAETGTVRVSPGFFNTKKQIKNFSFSVNQIAMEKKVC
ncbi:MAG: aminotransferase class V-fold PLP-dependent enzyme [Clostridia bacterium]|nr:aminotransferase class V-fold PLP-dependent enzyme [Clostridia bacterium]